MRSKIPGFQIRRIKNLTTNTRPKTNTIPKLIINHLNTMTMTRIVAHFVIMNTILRSPNTFTTSLVEKLMDATTMDTTFTNSIRNIRKTGKSGTMTSTTTAQKTIDITIHTRSKGLLIIGLKKILSNINLRILINTMKMQNMNITLRNMRKMQRISVISHLRDMEAIIMTGPLIASHGKMVNTDIDSLTPSTKMIKGLLNITHQKLTTTNLKKTRVDTETTTRSMRTSIQTTTTSMARTNMKVTTKSMKKPRTEMGTTTINLKMIGMGTTTTSMTKTTTNLKITGKGTTTTSIERARINMATSATNMMKSENRETTTTCTMTTTISLGRTRHFYTVPSFFTSDYDDFQDLGVRWHS